MNILLADTSLDMVKEWNRFFGDIDTITIYHGSMFNIPCDAIVSPTNSFGSMDNGLNLSISDYLGWHIQERLQEKIKTKYHGELLVGQAEIIKTDNNNFPYLIAAPTMRVPMILKDSVNPYLAMRAILLLISKGEFENGVLISDSIKSVVISGLGTGVGNISPRVCARQMRIAYEHVLHEAVLFPKSWFGTKELNDMLLFE
jgi:O-acetyl-ADP-ribose deacetylase (regulator of RNase III)